MKKLSFYYVKPLKRGSLSVTAASMILTATCASQYFWHIAIINRCEIILLLLIISEFYLGFLNLTIGDQLGEEMGTELVDIRHNMFLFKP